jgi:MFS family permease
MESASSGGLAGALARRGIHYAWVVVGVIGLAMLVSAGIRAMPGTLILPLEAEFGWDRAAITVAVSINLLLFGALGPLFGRFIDRSGPRAVAIAAVSLLGLGSLGTVWMTEVWQLDLLWGLVVGAGSAGMAMVLTAAVVNRWFVERRGLVTGILSAATSTGQIMFVPLAMWLTVTVGWRVAVLAGVGLLLCVVLPLVVLLFRNDPRDVGLAPHGESQDPTERAEQTALRAASTPMGQVARTADFWLLAGGFGICGFTSNGLIGTHFIPHAADHGIPEITAAGMFGLMGGLNILGTLASGMLCDRVPNRRLVLAAVYAIRGVGLLFLPFVDDVRLLAAFTVLFGLSWFATGAPIMLLAADRFGRRSVAQIYGWIFLSHQVGSALAATFGGVMHNWFGDYTLAFLLAGLTGLVAAGFSLQIREGRPAVAAQPAGA